MDFKSYAHDLNALARASFVGVLDAKAQLDAAQAAANQYPMHGGQVTGDYAEKAMDSRAKLNKAQRAFDEALAKMRETEKKMHELREKLQAAARDEYYPYGKDIDSDDVKALESGIMTPDEIAYMYEVAKKCSNWTMCRVIGKYAGQYAQQLDQDGKHTAAAELRALELDANQNRAESVVSAFDNLIETYSRTVNNTALISHWAELTAPIIDAM